MKSLLPLALLTLLLCGCPDTKVPKMPPKAPEPKVAATLLHSLPDAPPHERSVNRPNETARSKLSNP